MQVRDAIRKHPVSIDAAHSVTAAARAMDASAVGCLVVTDNDAPVGVVTDRDLVVRGLARDIGHDARVDSVMTPDPVTVDANADLRTVLAIFRTHPIRRLPVTDNGTLVGVIAIDDLLIDVTAELSDLVRAVTGQVLFGHPEPGLPTPVASS